jgi:hypothetical protein
MRKRHLAALVAAAALAAGGTVWADAASQPISYNSSGDPANDASSNHIVNGGDAHGGTDHGGTGHWAYNGGTSNGYAGNGGTSNGGSNGYAGNGGAPNGYGGHGSSTNGYASNGGTDSGAYGSGGEPDILKHGTGVSHLALLAGGNEVSKDGKAAAGDEDGKGAASLSLDPEAGTLCFGVVVNNIDGPVAAHIHQGKAGHNGPVVVPLKAPDGGNPGAVSGCIENVDRALLHAIHAHPWAYYVNIHTSAYPDGAIRGQIF